MLIIIYAESTQELPRLLEGIPGSVKEANEENGKRLTRIIPSPSMKGGHFKSGIMRGNCIRIIVTRTSCRYTITQSELDQIAG